MIKIAYVIHGSPKEKKNQKFASALISVDLNLNWDKHSLFCHVISEKCTNFKVPLVVNRHKCQPEAVT